MLTESLQIVDPRTVAGATGKMVGMFDYCRHVIPINGIFVNRLYYPNGCPWGTILKAKREVMIMKGKESSEKERKELKQKLIGG